MVHALIAEVFGRQDLGAAAFLSLCAGQAVGVDAAPMHRDAPIGRNVRGDPRFPVVPPIGGSNRIRAGWSCTPSPVPLQWEWTPVALLAINVQSMAIIRRVQGDTDNTSVNPSSPSEETAARRAPGPAAMLDSSAQPSRPLQPKATRGHERLPEYPTVKRRRPTVTACHHCRLKKIRCEGQRPACSSCETKALKCSYRDTTHASKASRESVPAVVHMLGQLPPTELARVVSHLKDEADTETILLTIKSSVAKQTTRQRDGSDSPSRAGSEDVVPRPKTPDIPLDIAGQPGTDLNWFWPVPCQPATDFAPLDSMTEPIDEYWIGQWSRAWSRLPTGF
ncbi:C6 transcription factor [Cordyceps javanica]|nr:C6 transcription factor [Cordyceps javanica]